ncbi:MAG: SUF system NifU family Fe-S cluster assembly protein [Coxiella sp. RIFCSPHIGHO2_12_FULL_42_15]|nr:MAG: SUF system NifU family Fe-S cluster assembly protein [Coxiella sp. RIFCSPHIGHO2_12_FULL_42_15]
MSDMHELYQQLIIDHGRKPRNFGELTSANHIKEGYNPLCGDKLTVYISEKKGVIEEIKFVGSGCAISMASASMMTQALKGKTLIEVQHYFEDFHEVVTTGSHEACDRLGKLAVLQGVSAYPARVKCATLCWHTLVAALRDSHEVISTESVE